MASDSKIYQVNLEKLIQDYAWSCYKRHKGFFTKLLLKRHNFDFDIRWGYVEFKHVTNPKENSTEANLPAQTEANPPAQTEANSPAHATNNVQELAIYTDVREINPTVVEGNKDSKELYFSEYENNTGVMQTYTFSTTRETTTSTKVEMQENYTLGAETNIDVNLGAIVKLGASASGSFSVTKTKSEEITKTLTWNIDTEIKVPEWNVAKASLHVCEIPSQSNFVVETSIRLPTGKLPVSIRRIRDDKEVHVEWIHDLGALFDASYKARSSVNIIEQKVVRANGESKFENVVVLTTRGVCRIIAWTNQHVKVECKKMDSAPVE